MKTWLKRYKVFLILLLVQLLLMFFMPELGQLSLRNIKSNLKEMLSIIPPIFVLLGLLDVWVKKETMIKYTGAGSGIKGVLISFIIGSAAAGPLYAAFPIATMMLKKGSSIFNVFIFIGAWSTTKIPMLTFEAGSLGVTFMLCRLALSIIGIMLIAFVIDHSLNTQEKEQIIEINK
ncbi:MAG: permease [Erysipelotrichaceae bacterium]|nr:permease [Erysipelotrichaceae bacterium]MDY5252187.1 permease [Erysipelotrichaceae bacterium]